ncbi:MAG TPA: fumarylacetoacetate hydrolase family protein [Symbiobacteriaceae bacterium]
MKLFTYYAHAGLKLGIGTETGVLDVAEAGKAAGMPAPADIHAVIAGGRDSLGALAKLAQAVAGRPELIKKVDTLRLAPCVPFPSKIVCVGLNYRRHAQESNMAIPTSPVLFSKFSNALSAPGSVIPLPAGSKQIDYEAELTIVMGQRAKGVSAADALGYVFGYCNANDLSARDLQFRTSQWLLGKTLDGFCPIGPHLVTSDEVPNPNNLAVRSWVNGELRQNSNTADMIFSCAEIISYVSQYMTLEPGDIILTGTPEGVVMGFPEDRRAQSWLKPGDSVTVEVEGLGQLQNSFQPEPTGSSAD